MKRYNVEYAVGLFMIAGLLCLFWLAMELGGIASVGSDTYSLRARFVSASGLKPGADVELAGVVVGQVTRISFVADDYEAEVELTIAKDAKLQDDAIASIRSTGIIGGKFLKITPGGSDILLAPGDEIRETESSVNFEELLSKYIFSSDNNSSDKHD
jgi:phospholipid/cholesterol/gamma-HCH transport system substrate-binding protein